MLKEVEALRKEFVQKIMEITGLPIDEITVDISLSPEIDGNESDLVIEARSLGWHPDRHLESAWYTTEIPQGGSVTVFVE